MPRAAAADPAHIVWADDLVRHIAPSNNDYGSGPSYITWAGRHGASSYTNRTTCSAFLTAVLKEGYGFTDDELDGWLGSRAPVAAAYHDAIRAQNGFWYVRSIDDVRRGDIVAISYPARETNSGHVALVHDEPTPREETEPVVPRTLQFEVTVVDSTSTPHGPDDTRAVDDGEPRTGAGMGVMRLYTNESRFIVGYTWSTMSGSVYYGASTRHLVVGRLR